MKLIKPRYVTEMRKAIDEFLLDHGVPDKLLLSTRCECEEFSREFFTLALLGRREMILYFSQENLISLQFSRKRNNFPIEFVRINCTDSRASAHLTQELNFILTLIIKNDLPPLEKVMRILQSDFGQPQFRKQLDIQSTSFFRLFPIFQVPSSTFYREGYGGGKNRDVTELFVRLSLSGQVEHQRFKVVYQMGNILRIDFIKIHLLESCIAFFVAVNGIITVWHTDKDVSLLMAETKLNK